MKITVDRDVLVEKLQTVLSVVATRTTLPILGNLLLHADAERLEIAATDLDLFVTCSIPAKVSKAGSSTVPARHFAEMVRELPEGDVAINVTSNRMEIRAGQGIYRISGMPADDFPKLPALPGAGEVMVPGDQLSGMVHRTSYAVSNDDTRPALNGVLWDTNGDTMHMVATDGHRLARVSVAADRLRGHHASLIIPPKALMLVIKILGESGDDVGVTFGEKNVMFHVGDTVVTSRLIEGPYPNYTQVIPTTNDKRMIVDNATLTDGVRRVAVLSNSLTRQVKFSLSKGRLELSTTNQDIGGEATETVPCQYDGEDLEIGYNANYVLDILKNLDLGDVVFELATSVSAGLVHTADEKKKDEYLCLVMPLRLAD